jgi:hypothetical protein
MDYKTSAHPLPHPSPPAQAEPHTCLHPASRTTMAPDAMVHPRQPRAQAQLGVDAEA